MANQPGKLRPYVPALWAGLIVLGLLIGTATLGRPLSVPSSGGAYWLPPDGHRQRFAGPDGVRVTEWAFDKTPSLLANGPGSFIRWVSVTNLDVWNATLARLSTVELNRAGEVVSRTDDLFSFGTDGVRAEVVASFDGGSHTYRPGRLELPNFLAAGRDWTSEGEVLVTDIAGRRTSATYRAEYSARPVGDKQQLTKTCLVVSLREQIGNQPATTSERTWCRGAGFVAYSTGTDRWQATATTPAAAPPEAPFNWGAADRLAFSSRRINRTGELGNLLIGPIVPPGILPGGTVIATGQTVADVTAVDVTSEPPKLAWLARPGVRTTTAATFGTTTVVAGVNRQLIAYGPAGQWLWEARLPDLTVVQPARIGNQVLVATLDGSITSYDLSTGTQQWQQRLPTEVRMSPVVGSDRVLVVDQGGQLGCFDAAGARLWTAEVGEVEHLAVTPGDDPVVVVPSADGPRVTGLALADGRELWRLRHLTNSLNRDAITLDGVTVLRGEDQTIGIDPTTGARLWSWSDQRTFAGIGGGDRLLLLADDRLILLDGHGARVTDWPLNVGGSPATTAWLSAAFGWVFVVGPAGSFVGRVR